MFKNFHCFLQLLLKSHSEFVVTILVSPITEPQQHSNVTNLGPRPVFMVVGWKYVGRSLVSSAGQCCWIWWMVSTAAAGDWTAVTS